MKKAWQQGQEDASYVASKVRKWGQAIKSQGIALVTNFIQWDFMSHMFQNCVKAWFQLGTKYSDTSTCEGNFTFKLQQVL